MYILTLRQHSNLSSTTSRFALMTYLELSPYQPTNDLKKIR